jgi:fibronectin-binding autotransporter adhesin
VSPAFFDFTFFDFSEMGTTMRQTNLKRAALSALFVGCLGSSAANANADTFYWNGSGGLSAGFGWDWNQSWSTDPDNSTPNPAGVPGASDIASFNISLVNSTVNAALNGNQAALGLNFDSFGFTTIRNGTAASTLSLGTSGITLNSPSGGAAIGASTTNATTLAARAANVNLMGSQTWTNNATTATSLLQILNNVTVDSSVVTPVTLTLDGTNTGANVVGNSTVASGTPNGRISDGINAPLSIVKNGTGTWVVTGLSSTPFGNTFTGGVTINSGILMNGNLPGSANPAALGTGPITFNGGELRAAGSATYSNNIFVNADAAITPKNLTNAGSISMNFTGTFSSTGTPGNGPVLTITQSPTATSPGNVILKGDISGFKGTFAVTETSGATSNGSATLALSGTTAASVDGSNAKFQLNGPNNSPIGTNDQIRFAAADGLTTKLGELSGSAHGWLLSVTQTFEVGALGTDSVFSGNLQGGTGSTYDFRKVGTGSLTLSGSNGFDGSATVSNGTLIAGADIIIPHGVAVFTSSVESTTDILTAATPHGLVNGEKVIVDYGLGTTDYLTLQGKPLFVVNATETTYQLSDTISGTPVDFVNNVATQAVNVALATAIGGNGPIALGDGGSSTNSAKLLAGTIATPNVTIARAVTVANNIGGTSTIGSEVDGNSVFSGTIALNKDLSITSSSIGGNALTVSGVVSSTGAFGLTKVGVGNATLTNTNTYTGTTTVSDGTLNVTGSHTTGGNYFVGVGSTGNLAINGGTINSSGNLDVGDGSVTIASASSLAVNDTVNSAGAGVYNINAGGTIVASNLRADAVNLDGVATINANGGAIGASRIETLNIGVASQLNLKNNDLVVGTAVDVLAVRSQIKLGQSGLDNTAAAAGITSDMMTLGVHGFGYALGNDPNLSTLLTDPGQLTGQAFDADSVLVKYTYRGDADLDGDADLVDLSRWAESFSGSLANPEIPTTLWTQGDWDYDGDTDLVDLSLWSANFTGNLNGGGLSVYAPNASPGAISALAGMGITVVPEPGTISLIGIGFCVVGVLRRSARRSTLVNRK